MVQLLGLCLQIVSGELLPGSGFGILPTGCLPPRLAWPPPLWGPKGLPPRKNFLEPGGGLDEDDINLRDLAHSFILASNSEPNRARAASAKVSSSARSCMSEFTALGIFFSAWKFAGCITKLSDGIIYY